jgi:hypothetical protein
MEQETKRKNIWAGIVSDAAYAGAKAMHDREQTQLRTAMKSQNVLTEINTRKQKAAQKTLASVLLRNAIKNRNVEIGTLEQLEAKNKIINLFRRKKEKELVQNLRQEKKQVDASNKIKDFIGYYLMNKREKAERIASEKIRDDLLAYGARLNYLRMLKGETPIQTKAGDTKTAKEILLKSILDKRTRNLAVYKLEGRQRMEEIKNHVPQSLLVVAPIINRPMPEEEQPKVHPAVEKYKNLIPLEYLKNEQNFKFKNIYASVVEDATNSALSRLVELDGKQYIAQQLAIDSPNIKLRKSTLSQKLGLEERNMEGNNLFSSPNNRNASNSMSRKLNKKADELYKTNLAKRLFGAYKNKSEERYNNMESSYNTLTAKPGRLIKGSQEAKDHMAKLRAMRTGFPRRTKAQIESDKIILAERKLKSGNLGRLVKGSQEAKDRMAVIRSMRVLKTWDPTKRALKPGTMFNKLVAFGPMKAPKKTPKPRAKTWDPTKRALKPGTVYNKLVAFGPMKAPKKTPKPRAKKSPPAPIRDAATIAALIARANFRPRTKPRGRPRKDAKVFY